MSKSLYVTELKENLKSLIKEYQDSKLYNDNEEESLMLLQEIYSLQERISTYRNAVDEEESS